MTCAVYLASSSPRRKELLTQLGIEFSQFSVDADESQLANELPHLSLIHISEPTRPY